MSFQESKPATLGSLAEKLVLGTDVVADVMHAACFVAGVALCILGLMLFKGHRDNPKFVPLDKPIMYLVLGLILFCIPFLHYFIAPTGYSVHGPKPKQVLLNSIDTPLNELAQE